VNICVTGGCGFIGSRFCQHLVGAGHTVTVLDLAEPDRESGIPAEQIRFVQGDVRDPDALRDAFDGCEMVIHLAAAHHDFGIADETYFSVNEHAAKTICDIMEQRDISKVCFYSTVAVYGSAPLPHDENADTRPETPYGASKLAGEKIFKHWAEQDTGRRALVIRPTVTFGPHNFANMYSLIRQIHNGKYLHVGPGSNIKSLAYIDNILDATMFLMNRDHAPAFDVFNYVDKPDLTSREIAETIFEALGKKPPLFGVPMWVARGLVLPFDIVIALTGKNIAISGARVKKLFATQTKFEADKVREAGFEARVPLREGIRRMVQWYVDEGRHQSVEWRLPPAEPRTLAGAAR